MGKSQGSFSKKWVKSKDDVGSDHDIDHGLVIHDARSKAK